MEGKTLARAPKTRKGKRALERREPLLVENTKSALLIRGKNSSSTVNNLLKDLAMLKKPNAKVFARKNDILPMEDASSIEFFSQKEDASLFAFSNHNKKRPNNLILGRLFGHQMLDMVELGVSNVMCMSDFPKTKKPSLGQAKPCLIFEGDEFEHNTDLAELKNLLLDFFRGEATTVMNSLGVDHVIVCTALDKGVKLRSYSMDRWPEGSKKPQVTLNMMGPCFDMALRRTQWAPAALKSAALRRPKSAHYKPKSVKNVRPDGIGNQIGHLHFDKQDLNKIATRKFGAFKKQKTDDKK